MDPSEQAAAFDLRELWTDDAGSDRRRPLSEYLARFPGYDQVIVREWLQLITPAPAMPAVSPAEQAARQPRLGPYRLVEVLG